jgi:hypothetical protein
MSEQYVMLTPVSNVYVLVFLHGSFLGAKKRLYNSLCWLVGPSVRWLVCPHITSKTGYVAIASRLEFGVTSLFLQAIVQGEFILRKITENDNSNSSLLERVSPRLKRSKKDSHLQGRELGFLNDQVHYTYTFMCLKRSLITRKHFPHASHLSAFQFK